MSFVGLVHDGAAFSKAKLDEQRAKQSAGGGGGGAYKAVPDGAAAALSPDTCEHKHTPPQSIWTFLTAILCLFLERRVAAGVMSAQARTRMTMGWLSKQCCDLQNNRHFRLKNALKLAHYCGGWS